MLWTQLKQNGQIDYLKNIQQTKNIENNLLDNLTTTDTSSNQGEINCQTSDSEHENSHSKTFNKKFGQSIIQKHKQNEAKVAKSLKINSIHLKKILNKTDICNFSEILQTPCFVEEVELQIKKYKENVKIISNDLFSRKMHNHIEDNFHLSNKKCLFYNMRNYFTGIQENVFDFLPRTFHIQNGLEDPEFFKFVEHFKKRAEDKKCKNIWIIKPGEMTNRGSGIDVCKDLKSINEILNKKEFHYNDKPVTYIVQEYIEKPLLYNKRKFDIRCYILITNVNGICKGYWYQEGYIRTASKEFNMKNLANKMIHLTNEAIQKKGDDFGKFESGNKVTFLFIILLLVIYFN